MTTKLVRDRIPQVIANEMKAHNFKPTAIEKQLRSHNFRVAQPEDLKSLLEAKLQEEIDEFIRTGTWAELADVIEVCFAISEMRGYSREELMKEVERKRTAKGGFTAGIIGEFRNRP